jgi:hypothetical protein
MMVGRHGWHRTVLDGWGWPGMEGWPWTEFALDDEGNMGKRAAGRQTQPVRLAGG